MSAQIALTTSELSSLREVAKCFNQGPVPGADARRLLDQRLIYRLLGALRLTTAGRQRLAGRAPDSAMTAGQVS